MNGMRVLGVIPVPNNWAEAFVFPKRQMESVRRLGCEVELFFLKSRTNLTTLFRERKRLRSLIREFQPDVIHAHFGTMTAFFSTTASWLPVVVSYRGTDLNPPGQDDNYPRWLLGYLLSQIAALRARSIICVSREVKSRLWWKASGAYVIPTGVDLDLFRPIPLEKARERMGWGMDDRIVLFSPSRWPKNKGIDLVQPSVEVARSIIGKIRLEMMDGSIDPDEVPWLMNAADCLVFASDYEGSPNVVKEAIACNLPVVSVEVGDVSEQLNGVSHSVIVPRDPQSMGLAIAEILRNPVRSNGHHLIAKISLEAVANKIIEVYRRSRRYPESPWPSTDKCQHVPNWKK
jgi:teichuronic acid biosynthesis glycosyltransferase TuaC